jgi:hypothetical protein
MKSQSYLWLLLAALACGCSALLIRPGTVTGVVHGVNHYDSTKIGSPLANHEVALLDSDTGNVAAKTKTDSDGRFSFTVHPGKYSLWGGEDAQYVEVKSGQTSTMDITAPEN